MPAVIGGAVTFPLLVTIACFLDRLPDPTDEDKANRTERIPLGGKQRMSLLKKYSTLLIPFLIVNVLYTVLRDIKEDFLVDILRHTSINLTSFLFVQVDSVITIILLVVFGAMILIKDNAKSLNILLLLMMTGSLFVLFTSLFFNQLSTTPPVTWLFLQSIGIYTAYLAFQTIFFDRFIACFRIAGNVGFFIYLADFLGYLFSCVFLLGKSVLGFEINWLQYYNSLSIGISLICILSITIALKVLYNKQRSLTLVKI